MHRLFSLVALLLFFSCEQAQEDISLSIEIIPLETGTNASLRGLSVVSENIAWASGSEGTFLRTIDGESWHADTVPGAGTYQFRDIEAFSENEAILMTAGFPAKFYKTSNGGESWTETYSNETEGIFFDAMGFWDQMNGIAFSDAIDGHLVIITTKDGGASWQEIDYEHLPASPAEGEGGFAASGTCLTTFGDSLVWIGLGSPDSRVFRSDDRGKTWDVVVTDMKQESSSAGIFSLAFQSESFGIAVGGDYEKPQDPTKNMAITTDGGATWKLKNTQRPSGYRSAIYNLPESEIWVASGRGGMYYSLDNGQTWQLLDTAGFYTTQFASQNIGYATGSEGRISKIIITHE